MATVNITVYNDADFYRAFYYQTIAGDPVDLTSASFKMMVRKNAKDAIAYLSLSTATGEITIIDAPGGSFTVRIEQEQLEEMSTGTYDHSLVMTMNEVKQQIWNGNLTINAGPSR